VPAREEALPERAGAVSLVEALLARDAALPVEDAGLSLVEALLA
jgi:hypothetical protein